MEIEQEVAIDDQLPAISHSLEATLQHGRARNLSEHEEILNLAPQFPFLRHGLSHIKSDWQQLLLLFVLLLRIAICL
jgi:hypothetical protein